MKVFVVLLSLASVALASLEPAGYHPPGSLSSQYLPPHLQEHDHHHHYDSHQPSPSSQYLPPNYERQTTPPPQYLPPRTRQPPIPVPSTNYLPATEKSQVTIAPSLASPANDYLPPLTSTSSPRPLANSYLPPLTRTTSAPINEYLPPSRTTVATPPVSEYLPPIGRQTPLAPVQPKQEYLPPLNDRQSVPVAPLKSEYLPPNRQRLALTTPVPIITSAPYKPQESGYPKQQSYQPKYTRANLATSSPVRSNTGYPQVGYPSGNPTVGTQNFVGQRVEQPTDNYLPPLQISGGYQAAQDGYSYGGAANFNTRIEESTEPAKYEFEYRVNDEYGNDFGHKESRDGDQTQGMYMVLLPDGRKQIVHYEADENGFKPKISYEDAANVLSAKTPALADSGAFNGYDKHANSLDNQGPY